MDLISVIILVALLILVVFLVVMLLPIMRAQLKAKKSGVAINMKEAHAISKIPDLPREFLNTASDLRKLDRDVYIGSLVDYHIAGGDLTKLKDGLEKIKSSGKDVSFNTLLLLNLAKKDVQEALDNIDKVYKVGVEGITENDITVNYSCEFKINFQDSFWVHPNLEEIKENVKSRVSLALLSADARDKNLDKFIKKHYLNRAFWREQAHAIVLNQNFEIE